MCQTDHFKNVFQTRISKNVPEVSYISREVNIGEPQLLREAFASLWSQEFILFVHECNHKFQIFKQPAVFSEEPDKTSVYLYCPWKIFRFYFLDLLAVNDSQFCTIGRTFFPGLRLAIVERNLGILITFRNTG